MLRLVGIGLLVLALSLLATNLFGSEATRAEEVEAGGVPLPNITRGRGEACVADTGFMRRNHMNLLSHQRDETVYEAVREGKFSLKGCIDCHRVSGPDAKPVGFDNPAHFCRACHDYAAAKIDCFSCHASRPQDADVAASESTRHFVALKRFLRERSR
jgi:hypothetical protein